MRRQNEAHVERSSASFRRLKEKKHSFILLLVRRCEPFVKWTWRTCGETLTSPPIFVMLGQPLFHSQACRPLHRRTVVYRTRVKGSFVLTFSHRKAWCRRASHKGFSGEIVADEGKPLSFALRYRLFVVTGLTSAEFRTLCKSRLVENYFRFALILFPPSSKRRLCAILIITLWIKILLIPFCGPFLNQMY